jgi:hypothetical protein
VVLHEVLEVVVPRGEIFRVVADVAGSAQAVGMGAVVAVLDDLGSILCSLFCRLAPIFCQRNGDFLEIQCWDIFFLQWL